MFHLLDVVLVLILLIKWKPISYKATFSSFTRSL